MCDDGYYDGWSEHTITVFATFDGLEVRIRDSAIKTTIDLESFNDYAADVFLDVLETEIDGAEFETQGSNQ